MPNYLGVITKSQVPQLPLSATLDTAYPDADRLSIENLPLFFCFCFFDVGAFSQSNFYIWLIKKPEDDSNSPNDTIYKHFLTCPNQPTISENTSCWIIPTFTVRKRGCWFVGVGKIDTARMIGDQPIFASQAIFIFTLNPN